VKRHATHEVLRSLKVFMNDDSACTTLVIARRACASTAEVTRF
jgi:hypothetical protein